MPHPPLYTLGVIQLAHLTHAMFVKWRTKLAFVVDACMPPEPGRAGPLNEAPVGRKPTRAVTILLPVALWGVQLTTNIMNSTRQIVVKLYVQLCYINIAPNPVLFDQENSGCRNS